MKTLITMFLGIYLAASAMAQGTLIWKNTVTPRAPIYEMDGTTPLEGSDYLVDLYYGAVGASPYTFTSLGLTTPFGTGIAAGYFNAEVVSIPGFAPGAQIQIQARAWRASDGATWLQASSKPGGHATFVWSGSSGISEPRLITVTLGGFGSPPSVPATFDGYLLSHSLNSICLCPEPSTALVAFSGLVCCGFLYRRKA